MKEFLQKYKKLVIILGIVFGVVIVGVILNFTLLSLSFVEVDFKNQTQIYTEESMQRITNDSVIEKGVSIFGINKKKIASTLEKNNPYLKIINIETVFPNKIVIHCAEREETYAVKTSTNYFVCDAEFKVLNITPMYYNEQSYAILFKGLENYIMNINRVNVGDFLQFLSDEKILKNVGTSLLKANKSVAMQKSLIREIEFTSNIYYYTAQNQPYLIITDYNGFKTNIYAIETLLPEKFECMFASLSKIVYNPEVFFKNEIDNGEMTLNDVPSEYYLDYTLKILEDLQGKLHIRLEKINND